MRPINVSILAAIALFAAAPADAQPSFDCGANLNATERAICENQDLGVLDRGMARRFYRLYQQLSGDRALAFRKEQTEWRHNRDACGATVGCIKANYVYRLGQFGAMGGNRSPPDGAGVVTRSPSATVLADGTIEKRMSDGSLSRYLPNGRVDRYGPDGKKLPNYQYRSQVQIASLPPLPPPLQSWGAALESRLGTILGNILTDDEYVAYQSTEAGKDDYALIDWRLRSISILTQP